MGSSRWNSKICRKDKRKKKFLNKSEHFRSSKSTNFFMLQVEFFREGGLILSGELIVPRFMGNL